MAAAWPPCMIALAPSLRLLRLAASTPRTSAASPASEARRPTPTLRAMCRWVTCDSSWASTEASSSRETVIAISPRWTPT